MWILFQVPLFCWGRISSFFQVVLYVSKKPRKKKMCPPKKLNHISKYFLRAGTSRGASVHGDDSDDSEGDDDDNNIMTTTTMIVMMMVMMMVMMTLMMMLVMIIMIVSLTSSFPLLKRRNRKEFDTKPNVDVFKYLRVVSASRQKRVFG